MREEVYAALIKRFNIKVDYGDEVITLALKKYRTPSDPRGKDDHFGHEFISIILR